MNAIHFKKKLTKIEIGLIILNNLAHNLHKIDVNKIEEHLKDHVRNSMSPVYLILRILQSRVLYMGNHGSLLVIHINDTNSYYGDSLSWPLPCNLKSAIKTTIDFLSVDLHMNINECLDNISILNSSEKFYPSQTCSNMCGIIVICMVGLFCEYWEAWLAHMEW